VMGNCALVFIRRLIYIVIIIAVLTGVMVGFYFFVLRDRTFSEARQEECELEVILRDYDVKLLSNKETGGEEIKIWLKKRDEVVEQLERLGTNVLPQLIGLVRKVGKVYEKDPNTARQMRARLLLVFRVLGSNAAPLLPELIKEYQAGRNIGPVLDGIIYIGATEGGLAIVPGLTNIDTEVRLGTISAISYFRTNALVIEKALPLLLKNLDDSSQPIRAVSASVLGSFQSKPEVVIPALVRLAEHDKDLVVRSVAVKGIGEFGASGIIALSNLEVIARADREEIIRQEATNAIRKIKGELKK